MSEASHWVCCFWGLLAVGGGRREGECAGPGKDQLLVVLSPEPHGTHGRSYKVSVLHLEIPGRGYANNQGWLPLWFQGCLTRDTGHAEVCNSLFGVCGPSRDYRKICNLIQGRLLVRNNTERDFLVG